VIGGIIKGTEVMAKAADIRVGTAGWSIPGASASRFDSAGTHLERYSRRLDCAEINSSFHRPHAATTYAKWRASTPPGFRFAVKMPRAITHELKLQGARAPSLSFDNSVVTAFLDMVRREYDGPIVCEPRHATWFSPPVASLLEGYRISRVAADPPPVPDATGPAGCARVAYFRLHGSPRTYWSRYDENAIAELAATLGRISTAEQVWCVFDNTASGAAIENAWELREHLSGDSPTGRFIHA
jgi:uncharacterized protein YecE (DUF72 family)